VAEMPGRRTRSRVASPALAVFSNARSPTYQRHRLSVSFTLSRRVLLGEPSILHFASLERSEPIVFFFFYFLSTFSTYIPSLSHVYFFLFFSIFFYFFLFFPFTFASFEPGQLSSMDSVHVPRRLNTSILRVYPFVPFLSSSFLPIICHFFFYSFLTLASFTIFSSWSYFSGMIPWTLFLLSIF
jgi:hypothetical protein